MRLRNIKGSKEVIAASPYVVQNPEDYKGKWSELFHNNHPLHIEIGMGKGRFIHTLASENPNINYIGIEKFSSVLVRAVQKQNELELPNLCLIRMDADSITDVFAPGEVDRIYLNFSDPWPKERHAKRRLTSVEFLRRYENILAKDGHVEFKTDNQPLFEFSLEAAEEAGWKLLAVTRDLHHDTALNKGNIMTEYEERFSAQGNPICKMILCQA